jgi:hypothetical protein
VWHSRGPRRAPVLRVAGRSRPRLCLERQRRGTKLTQKVHCPAIENLEKTDLPMQKKNKPNANAELKNQSNTRKNEFMRTKDTAGGGCATRVSRSDETRFKRFLCELFLRPFYPGNLVACEFASFQSLSSLTQTCTK